MLSGDWRGRRVLVTGGAGFLGSALCHDLGRLGARVTVLDSFAGDSGANPANLAGAEVQVLRADLRTDDLAPACRGVDAVFNLAAQAGHMLAQQDPERDLATNAAAQLRLIQALRTEAPGAIVVHASTRQVYGPPRYLPVDEAHPIQPPDANGISKWAGEQYWLLEHRLHGRAVSVLRLTNCYGPRQHIRDSRQSFLGGWLGCLLRGQPFEVWGGCQMRDLLFVDDAVAALLAAASAACQGRTFNVGGAPALALRDVARALTGQAPGDLYRLRPMPPCRGAIDIGSYVSDDSAFRAATGWVPAMAVGPGLRVTLEWFRPRLHQYA